MSLNLRNISTFSALWLNEADDYVEGIICKTFITDRQGSQVANSNGHLLLEATFPDEANISPAPFSEELRGGKHA